MHGGFVPGNDASGHDEDAVGSAGAAVRSTVSGYTDASSSSSSGTIPLDRATRHLQLRVADEVDATAVFS